MARGGARERGFRDPGARPKYPETGARPAPRLQRALVVRSGAVPRGRAPGRCRDPGPAASLCQVPACCTPHRFWPLRFKVALAPPGWPDQLAALILVFNPVLARLLLKEPIPARVLAGVATVLAGTGLLVGFGPMTDEHSEDIRQLIRRLYEAQFLAAFSGSAVLSIGLCVVAKRIESSMARDGHQPSDCDLRWLCCCYTINNGFISGCQFLQAKWLTMLFDNPDPAGISVVIGLLLLSVVLQIFWMNKGLAAFQAQLVVPLGVTLTIVFSELLGGTFFDEFRLIKNPIHAVLFAVGFAVVLAGCLLIVTSSSILAQRLDSRQGLILSGDDKVLALPSDDTDDTNESKLIGEETHSN